MRMNRKSSSVIIAAASAVVAAGLLSTSAQAVSVSGQACTYFGDAFADHTVSTSGSCAEAQAKVEYINKASGASGKQESTLGPGYQTTAIIPLGLVIKTGNYVRSWNTGYGMQTAYVKIG